MKILYIDETFHPSYGYQANPLAKFQQAQGHEVIIATVEKKWMYPVYRSFGDDGTGLEEADARYERDTGVKIIRVPAKGYVARRLVYGKEIFQVVDQVKPDVIFIHCVETLTAIRFLFSRKMRKNYPMMFDSHMLKMASTSKFAKLFEKGFQLLVTPIIKKNNYEVIRTQDDDYVNSRLAIPMEQTPFISFGTDTKLFYPSQEVRAEFRKKHEIPEGAFTVVYTGKLTEAKNGKLLAEAFKEKFTKPVSLICVGTPPDTEYGRQVKALLDASQNQVIMFPTQNYMDLGQFYQAADLSVFPKQCSMSFYDAQACGLPVLSENNNVNVDRCSHGNGRNFKANDISSFRGEIQKMIDIPKEEYEQMRQAAIAFIAGDYDYEKIAQQYTECLERAVERFLNKK